MGAAGYLCLMYTMGLLGLVRPDVNCKSEIEMVAAQGECFSDQGLDVTRPIISTPEAGKQLAGYIDVALKQIPESVCKKLDDFRRALKCLGNLFQQCGLSSISPTSTLPQSVDKLCIHDTNLNLTCAASKFNDIMQCEAKKISEIRPSSSLTANYCKMYKSENDCQRSLYYSCGCATVRAYETIYLDIFYQAVCPKSLSSISRVECDANNTSFFLSNGVVTSVEFSVLPMFLLLASVLYCYSFVF